MPRPKPKGAFPIPLDQGTGVIDRKTASRVLYRVEKWADYAKDAEALWPLHYAELALDQDRIKLDVDWARYEEADRKGQGLIITARDEGSLIGYFIVMLLPHMHYKSAGTMGYPDVYFVLPEYRKAGVGAKLIIATEIACKAIGVTKIYMSCKVHQDHSRLFELLGYKPSDLVFTKVL